MYTLKIHDKDNVAVDMATGQKVATDGIKKGESIIKYGFPIGHATEDIAEGHLVHTHNLKTNLGSILEYEYDPKFCENAPRAEESEIPTVNVFHRENGDIGIRNDIWIINTVGCVNKTAEILAQRSGAFCFTHPFGCSQLGDDHKATQLILKGLVNHPNAGGVLVLGLGCENNNITEFKKILGDVNGDRVKFLNTQDEDDEINSGIDLINRLKNYAECFKRQKAPVSKLKAGLKCGGSDAFSGITANPLVGQFSDLLISYGGISVLTEVPEMFGAETLLMNRCINADVFNKTVNLINNFKRYFIKHGQEVYENPSPGNKAGGITTLEEKSLGCTQKGGTSPVVDVLGYGDSLSKNGLNLLDGPGNDIMACTNLVAAGVHFILFTTGRGTPLGSPVPTVKIASNSELYVKKPHWIDFDAGKIKNGEALAEELFNYICRIAEGLQTNNEKNGYREISIFKDGVCL